MRDRLIELLLSKSCWNNECPEVNCEDCDCIPVAIGDGDRIADYLLANGVIVPPCKVGQTVYKVVNDKRVKKPYKCKVIGFWYSEDEHCNNVHLVRYINGVFDCSFSVPFTDFGKSVFLTREEAEQALKGGVER